MSKNTFEPQSSLLPCAEQPSAQQYQYGFTWSPHLQTLVYHEEKVLRGNLYRDTESTAGITRPNLVLYSDSYAEQQPPDQNNLSGPDLLNSVRPFSFPLSITEDALFSLWLILVPMDSQHRLEGSTHQPHMVMTSPSMIMATTIVPKGIAKCRAHILKMDVRSRLNITHPQEGTAPCQTRDMHNPHFIAAVPFQQPFFHPIT